MSPIAVKVCFFRPQILQVLDVKKQILYSFCLLYAAVVEILTKKNMNVCCVMNWGTIMYNPDSITNINRDYVL